MEDELSLTDLHVESESQSVAPARGGKGGAVAPPMLKKMVLVILPNSMRKLGGEMRIHLRCEKIINTKYLYCDSSFLYGLFITGLLFRAPQSTFHRFLL